MRVIGSQPFRTIIAPAREAARAIAVPFGPDEARGAKARPIAGSCGSARTDRSRYPAGPAPSRRAPIGTKRIGFRSCQDGGDQGNRRSEAEDRGFEPRMGVNPNRISSAFSLVTALFSHVPLVRESQVIAPPACRDVPRIARIALPVRACPVRACVQASRLPARSRPRRSGAARAFAMPGHRAQSLP